MTRFLREHYVEIVRSLFVIASLFLVSYLIESIALRAIAFLILGVFFVLTRIFASPRMEADLNSLKESVEKTAEGNLVVPKWRPSSSSEVMHDFSMSLLMLVGRFQQIVEKVKNVADRVSNTSERIVELSRFLLQSGQNESQASERAAQAMSEINAAIKRIASAAQSLNELGITASSAALELTASIEEVSRNALQVGVFAKDTQTSMESMVQGMKVMEEASEMLMAASRDTDASMQHMHRRIEEVTQRALESDELSERASAAAQTGAKVVEDVEAGMGQISDAFENVGRVIGNLAQRSEQIGQILNVITQVSDQTNLLSLNAAILSAQAGVHGKGFAVVADEIRKLSNRTAASVQEIEQLISSVRVEISETVNSMEAGKTRLVEGFERSRRASEALSEILASTAATRQRVAAITESTGQQTQAENEVQRATATIKSRLDQITKIIKEQTRASKEVYVKADRMIELLRNVERGMEEQTHGAKEVSGIVEHLSGIIQNIHLATAEQSTRSSQVVHSVDSLRSAVQSGMATISALNSTAISLGQESFILNHELSQFQLPQAKSGGTLALGIAAKVSSLDPAYSQYVFIFDWIYNFYEGLVEFGEGTDIRPCLAERWEVSDDRLVYTFHLKRGVLFHNGKELTAKDVQDSFERILHPMTKSSGTWVFEMITGAEEFVKGNQKSMDGICILDPYTLKVRLRQPVPFFLGMMAQPFAYVLPSTLATTHAPLTEVCGTGPFRLDRFVPEHFLEMTRFVDYHAAPLPYLDRVTAEFGLRENEIAEGIRTGKYHFTTELQKHSLDEFLSQPEWRPRLQTNVQLYTALLALSCKIPPLDDVRVRQAIAFAVDRDRIVRDVVGTVQAIVARTLLPPGLPGHDSSGFAYAYDPERARSLLRQAGIAPGTRLETWHAEAASNLDVLKIIQENLKDVGLDLHIREVDPDVHSKAIDAGMVPMRMTRWIADYPDPDNFLYITFHSKSPVYNLGFQDAEFDQLVEEARSLPDIQERIRLYQRAERIWLQKCPCICLYHNQALVLHQDSLQGCVPHFTNPVVRLKKIWLS